MHRSAGKAAKSSNGRHLAPQPDALGVATRLVAGRLPEAGIAGGAVRGLGEAVRAISTAVL